MRDEPFQIQLTATAQRCLHRLPDKILGACIELIAGPLAVDPHRIGKPKGTAWHPHRGFETVTYMIDGIFEHADSNGGGGQITNGDTQWMTAGGGVLHIERPPEHLMVSGGLFHGLQLWVNLPAKLKWTEHRYAPPGTCTWMLVHPRPRPERAQASMCTFRAGECAAQLGR